MAGRGQSSVRMWKKAALTRPVQPTRGKDGFKQPPYMRSHSASQTAKKLSRYKAYMRECIHKAKKDGRIKKGMGRPAIQAIFRECAEKCSFVRHRGKKAASEGEFPEYGEDELFWE